VAGLLHTVDIWGQITLSGGAALCTIDVQLGSTHQMPVVTPPNVSRHLQITSGVRLPDLSNKNTRCLGKCEFQKND